MVLKTPMFHVEHINNLSLQIYVVSIKYWFGTPTPPIALIEYNLQRQSLGV